MSMYIGKRREGSRIAHIDLLIGDKSGPVGVAFANALAAEQKDIPTSWRCLRPIWRSSRPL